jgi:hypothetical protein
MNGQKCGPLPIASVNGIFSQAAPFNDTLIFVYNYCIRKLIAMKASIERKIIRWKGHWIRKWGRKRNKWTLINKSQISLAQSED